MIYDDLLSEYISLFHQVISPLKTTRTTRGANSARSITGFDARKILVDKCIEESLRNGLPKLISEGYKIDEYVPFSDAIGSQFVGKAKVSCQLVVKAGQEEVKEQVKFMKMYSDIHPYPTIIHEKEENGVYACLMQFMGDYYSLHELIFKERANDRQISVAIDSVFSVMEEIYKKTRDETTIPNIEVLYTNRFQWYTEKGRQKYTLVTALQDEHDWDELFPEGFDSLLDTSFIYDEGKTLTYAECIENMRQNFPELGIGFTALIHGDAHPGNFMLCRDDLTKVTLIDPNPALNYSDYIYDLGKMLNWLELTCYFALEKATGESYANIKLEKYKDKIKAELLYPQQGDEGWCQLQRTQKCALERFWVNAQQFCQELGDKNWEKRLHLACASASIGGLKFFERPSGYFLSFINALKHLSRCT